MKKISSYIAIARFDHWVKNIFVIPGFVCAFFFDSGLSLSWHLVSNFLIALLATGFIASSNYIINEYLDREFDRQHPIKKNRKAANNLVTGRNVFAQYLLFIAVGVGLSLCVGVDFTVVAALLIFMGILYNVSPIRTKDKPYIDVLSESVNNPLRFLLGWFAIQHAHLLPPSSILLSYWMGGAYLMAVKRYSELRQINDAALAATYRKSFAYYNNDRLLVSALFYATLSTLFLGIFLIKYRIEYMISAPFIALLFAWYLNIGLKTNSAAVAPEKLYKEVYFAGYIVFLVALFMLLTFIDIPAMNGLVHPVRMFIDTR